MADAFIRPDRLGSSRRFAVPTWAGVAALIMRRRSAPGPTSCTPTVAPGSDSTFTDRADRESAGLAISHTRFPLLNAYAASALDMDRRVGALGLQPGPDVGPVAVQALVGEVLQRLEPLARRADLALLRDAQSGCDGVCCAAPELLRSVVSHLVLRALSLERTPGHVRIMVTLTAREANILILSRTPETTLADHRDAPRHDLVAPQRLLHAMGGALVLEPRRAGYLPLCIALPALTAATTRCAA